MRILVYVLVPLTKEDLKVTVNEFLCPYHNENEDEFKMTGDLYCNGEGVERSHWNPNSRWDWCLIGDEWNWDIPLERCLLAPCDLQLGGGAAPLKNLDIDKLDVPTAVVTPDGVWHEEYNLPPDWFKQILKNHADTILVGVLCHR